MSGICESFDIIRYSSLDNDGIKATTSNSVIRKNFPLFASSIFIPEGSLGKDPRPLSPSPPQNICSEKGGANATQKSFYRIGEAAKLCRSEAAKEQNRFPGRFRCEISWMRGKQ